MVHLNYDSDDDGYNAEPASQKYHLRHPITPYVCSTPLDFDAERDFLAREVFPKLQEICLSRGTAFSPIDIQWKPNSVQTESGHLIRINLDFILKCSPYFLCLLGETYGPHRPPESGPLPSALHDIEEDGSWLDRNFLIAAQAGYHWVLKEAHQNGSIAELEIIQAAFLTDNQYCHFYYRQPEHLDFLCEGVSETDIEGLVQLHKPVSEYADLSIRDLKQRIVNKGLPVKYFRTKAELGSHVFSDWLEIINQVCPPLLDAPPSFDLEEYQEWLSHEVFADSRRRVYINHTELRSLRDELNQFCHIALDDPFCYMEEPVQHYTRPSSISSVLRKQSEVAVKCKSILAVRGERGSGKSSLVANWVKHYRADNPEVKVISHYVGASGRSRDITTFLRTCVTELREEYLKEDMSGPPDKELIRQNYKSLCESFHAALSLGPCVLLLDGVDELGASLGLAPQEIKTFSWIPLPLPPLCKMVVTTGRSDYSHSSLAKRPDVKFVSISNINTTKLKVEFLEDHMQRHYEHLNRVHIQTIFETKLSNRPLFLTIMGTEMSSFGVYTDLNAYTETIREMVTSVRDLYVRSIKRWSLEHSWTYEVLSSEQTESPGVEYIGWVPDVLRLLAVSRSGLMEIEILEILEKMGYQENVRVRQFDWLMFSMCLGDNVTESPYGVFNFTHQHLREVVEYILLRAVKPSTAEIITPSDSEKPWKKQKGEFHQQLAKFFYNQPHSQRRSQELPWQLLMAGDLVNLKHILSVPELFISLYDPAGTSPSNHYDLVGYWRHLESAGHRAVDTYKQLVSNLGFILEEDLDHLEVESLDESVSESVEISAGRSESAASQIALFTPTSPSIPRIYTTPANNNHKLSVIEEASDMSKDEKGSGDELQASHDSVFLTQDPAQITGGEVYYDLSQSQVTSLVWYICQFLIELGHKQAGESILVALNTRLMQSYPLTDEDQLVHARIQECLARLYMDRSDHGQAETWYRKALKTIGDMYDMEEASPIYPDLQNLKCLVIRQIGYLRLEEGLLDSADDLLLEALELAEVSCTLPTRATVLYHIGILRLRQTDHLMAETNLRKALSFREKWYGRSHPEVADILFTLGMVLADENYYRGFDKTSAESMLRRCLEIRENHFEKDDQRVADVLFELGKLLRHDRSYMGKTECQRHLRRAHDIRITQLGGDHIETRAVRQYLNNLETNLKSAKIDSRSSDRPYSSLSWRGNDLANLERRSRIQSGKSSSVGQLSRPGSQISRTGSQFSHSQGGSRTVSRPVSGQMDYTVTSPKGNLSYLPASERYLLESGKPRLLNRDSMERKLKPKDSNFPLSPRLSPRTAEPVAPSSPVRQISVDMKSGEVEVTEDKLPDGVLLDSYGNESEKMGVKFKSPDGTVRLTEDVGGRDTPQRQVRHYSSPQGIDIGREGMDTSVVRTGEQMTRKISPESNSLVRRSSSKARRPAGSARSMGSSMYTSASALSVASSRSHKSSCHIPAGPHSIHLSNARTTTMGPHSSLNSLMGYTGPKDVSKGIHHKSAWYHVPGRYTTAQKKHPPKRSQQRIEAKKLQKTIVRTEPDPYTMFMKSDYRKNNPRNVDANYPGLNGHTCRKGQLYPPYPRREQKQYIVCDQCQHDTEEILAANERELLGIVEGSFDQDGLGITPTVNGLTTPDRPKQVSYVMEEVMLPGDLDYPHTGATVTFNDAVVMN